MRYGILFGAIVAASLAGAALGVFGTRAAIGFYPFRESPLRNGWAAFPLPTASSSNTIEAALARAVRAQRDPSAFSASLVRTYLSRSDDDGRALTGASRYVMRFARSDIPSADAHWTLAVLTDDAASIDDGRAALTGDAADLHRNRDGSIEIAVQATSPDDPVANWLATPPGPFRLVMRIHSLTTRPGTGDRLPPPVTRRETAA